MHSFYERPILNSPYRVPALHHPLDPNGQPLAGEPRQGRRPSRFIVPVPASRKKPATAQSSLDLETYTENALINEIRGYLDAWRTLRNPRVARSLLQGNAPNPLRRRRPEIARACGKLLTYDRVNVINDEAYHCYAGAISSNRYPTAAVKL